MIADTNIILGEIWEITFIGEKRAFLCHRNSKVKLE